MFEGFDSLRDQCFAEATANSVAMLLSFGDAIARSKRSPEKLFVLLDMYEIMRELQSEVLCWFLASHQAHLPTTYYVILISFLSHFADWSCFQRQILQWNQRICFGTDKATCSNSSRNFWWFWRSSRERCNQDICSRWHCTSPYKLCYQLCEVSFWVSFYDFTLTASWIILFCFNFHYI